MEPRDAASTPMLRISQAAARLGVQVLFVVVAVLLLADFRSAYRVGEAEWQANPFISALSEHVGPELSLVAVKCADVVCLLGLYALWHRSKAHLAIALVLMITATVYAQIVFNN